MNCYSSSVYIYRVKICLCNLAFDDRALHTPHIPKSGPVFACLTKNTAFLFLLLLEQQQIGFHFKWNVTITKSQHERSRRRPQPFWLPCHIACSLPRNATKLGPNKSIYRAVALPTPILHPKALVLCSRDT